MLNELEEANLQDDEQEELEAELKQLEHAEEIKLKLTQALQYLSEGEMNVVMAMKDASHLIGQVAAYSDIFEELKERARQLHDRTERHCRRSGNAERRTEADPQRLEVIQDRLNLLYTLQRKHQVQTVAELLLTAGRTGGQSFRRAQPGCRHCPNQKGHESGLCRSANYGKTLSESRKKVFPKFEAELHSLLSELGMPNARIVIEHQTVAPRPPASTWFRFCSVRTKAPSRRP